MNTDRKLIFLLVAVFFFVSFFAGCTQEKITSLDLLADKTFGVPSGTIADELVKTKFPNAKFKYYDTVADAVEAVKKGEVAAAAYDEPILRNLAAKNTGLIVLAEMITIDEYGFATAIGKNDLKMSIDMVIAELKSDGTYDEMIARWLPDAGAPGSMPVIASTAKNGILRFGTAAITEPFSFFDKDGNIIGFDIELAQRIAKKLEMELQVVNMEFGALIGSLESGEVDMIGACITISEERAKRVLFSDSYYQGGIAALVKK